MRTQRRMSPVVTVVEGLAVGWRQVTAVLVQPPMIEPVDPFEGGDFDPINGPPRPPPGVRYATHSRRRPPHSDDHGGFLATTNCGALGRRAGSCSVPVRGGDRSVVRVAPPPVITGMKGLRDRMATRLGVMTGVPHRRRIRAADITAAQTKHQMIPARPECETSHAPLRRMRHDIADHAQVRIRPYVGLGHMRHPSLRSHGMELHPHSRIETPWGEGLLWRTDSGSRCDSLLYCRCSDADVQ